MLTIIKEEYSYYRLKESVGPHVSRDGKLEYSAFAGGYFDPQGGTMYYLTDWQGNNAVVADNRGNVVQETTYYPYGEPTIEPTGQRYLFGGKEREHAGGRNAYDFGARILTPYGSWSTPDPLAEKLYPISPYSYCGGDPINNIDPDGKQVFVLPPPLLGMNNPLLLSASKPVIPRVAPKGPNPIENHHIIPRSLSGKNQLLQDAIRKGFKLDGKGNKIPVEKFSKTTGTGRHAKHGKYTERVADKLEKASKELDNVNKDADSPYKIPLEDFNRIVEEIRQKIIDNPDVKINDLEFQTVPPILDQLRKMLNEPENKGKRDFLPHEHPEI